jgi:hypothetical protein
MVSGNQKLLSEGNQACGGHFPNQTPYSQSKLPPSTPQHHLFIH